MESPSSIREKPLSTFSLVVPCALRCNSRNNGKVAADLTMASINSGKPAASHHAVLAGFLGWTLDAFDFFVVVFLFDTLAQHFGVAKKDIVLTTTATLAMRPVC